MNIASLFSFLDGAMFLLSHLATVHCSNFHVNTITGSGIMAVFVYKKLTRKWEIVNIPSEFCPMSGDWDKSGIPNLAQNVSNKKLLNAAKCQGYSYYRF